MRKILAIVLLLFPLFVLSQNVSYYNGHAIETGKVIVKFHKNALKSASVHTDVHQQDFEVYLRSIQANNFKQQFPQSKMPANCENCVDISSIYSFTYSADVPMEKVLSTLNAMSNVEYAEPSYIAELLFEPNDTEYPKGNLWHLNTCKVLDAWDIEEGDPDVVVAIVDGGIDIIHGDLINQIAYNVNDPINGIDDDGDGYVDNYRGWDIADNDNNPSSSSATEHGTYVAGIASAEVNNEFGTAGVGYKTKFMPIKVCPEGTSSVTGGYEGIIYAANQGCKVINCSWGDEIGTKYGNDIINYATFNCDALVVAAAGNSASSVMYYPASYPNALSVGGTVAGDFVWAESATKGSHYNRFVDICAPAKGFYSIANNNKVIAMSGGGTSFSCPIVAGAAALVKSKYPDYSALQVAEQLCVSADDLYEINSEEMYRDKLGHGRLNLYKALTDDVMPSIRIVKSEISNRSHQPHIYAGDTIDVNVTFKNFLHDAENVTIAAICETSILSVIDCNAVFESIKSNEEKQATFTFRVSATLPTDLSTYFKFTYGAAHKYVSYEYLPASFNPDYYDFTSGNISSTATRDGSIAVYNVNANQNGFKYKDFANCIYQAGLVLAQNQNTIYSRSNWRNDFVPGQSPQILESDSCDLLIYSDFFTPDSLLPIQEYIYAWNDMDAQLYEFRLKNELDSTLHNVKFGTFIDWDILNSAYNQTWFVDSLQMVAAVSVDPRSYYVGWLPLDYHKVGVYAFSVGEDILYYSDGFNNNELWYALNNSQWSAGANFVSGREIASFNYCTLDSIAAYDSVVVRYALLAADTKTELYELAYQLKQIYNPNPKEDVSAVNSEENIVVSLSKENGNYFIQYEQSNKPICIQTYAMNGQRDFYVELLPENQIGQYVLPQNSGLHIVVVQREGKTYTFKITAE